LSEVPTTAAEPRRLFFALWPSQQLQEQMHGLARDLVRSGSARLIPAEKLHLTLAFLGSVDAARQACYEQAADAIRTGPFTLTLDEAGVWRRSGIVWVGTPRTPAPLLDLVRDLSIGLARCGHEPETRPFKVHVTVARNARGHRHAARGRLPESAGVQAAAAVRAALPFEWAVDDFCLVQSQMLPDGARYQILKRWALG
jgi:2'-5' RNA ligase